MTPEPPPAEKVTLVHRLLAGLVAAVCRRPVLVLAVLLALSAVSVWGFVTRLEYRTQRTDLVSPDKEYQQRWRAYLAEFGNDDDMVVVVRGSDRERMKAALEELADRIRQQPELFDRLFYKVDLRPLHRRALLFLPAEQIEQVRASLKPMEPLLRAPLSWRLFTLQQLLNQASVRANALAPEAALSAADEQFLGQLLAISKATRAALADPAAYRSPWRDLAGPQPTVAAGLSLRLLAEPQYFFSGDGELAFLLVRPVQEEGSFTAADRSVSALRSVLDEVRPGYPELEMGLTGLPVLENDEMTASQRDTNLASWLALAGVAALYLLVFRGLRCPALTVGTLLVGTALAMGWLTLTVGHLNILSATFAMMLIGMGDYGVLWVTRYEQERAAGAAVVAAMRTTAASVGPGILTAATTTALAFFATMLADFQAVSELGWIAGSGVLLCALSCFTTLPALLKLTDRRKQMLNEERGTRNADSSRSSFLVHQSSFPLPWLPFLSGRPGWVVGLGLALTIVLGAFACRVSYDHNLLHMQAEGLDSVKWELTLIEHTAGASWHALSWTETPEEALALKARYEKLECVSRVVEVASLVPPDQARKCELLRDIHKQLARLPKQPGPIPQMFPSTPSVVLLELDPLLARLEELTSSRSDKLPACRFGNGKQALVEEHRELSALREQLQRTPTTVADARLKAVEARIVGDLAADLRQLRDVSHPEPITLADLPPELRERYVGKNGKWLLRVFGKDCLWDYEPLKHFVREIQTVDANATGKPFATLYGLRSMRDGFLWAGFYALLVIVAVLALDFRNVLHLALGLAPLAMGVVLTLGVMGLVGMPFNPANMIALPLIVGVGVDNGVHVLHDFLSRGSRRGYALSQTTGKGMLVAALTTILGFGTLMISSHRGLIGLGLILSLGVTCSMVSALVFLPAVLRLLGRRQRPSERETIPLPAARSKAA